MNEPSTLRFGPFRFEPGIFRLLRGETPLPVEPKALDLLALLLDRAPHVVDKAEIFSVVWKDVAVTDNALTRVVAQLRRALDDDSRAPTYIETIATRGYRFIAPVERGAVGTMSPSASPPLGETRDVLEAVPERKVPIAIASASAVVILVLATIVVWVSWGRMASAPSHAAPTDVVALDVARLAAVRPTQMTTGTGFDGFLAFAPDGRSFAFTSDRSGALEIYVQGMAPGSTPVPLTNNGKQNVQAAWSPDGEYIAYHEMVDNGIWIVPSRGGAARKVSPFGSYPAWSPDGRTIAFHSMPVNDIYQLRVPGSPSTIWTVDVGGAREPAALTLPGQPAGPHLTPSWWRDSRRVLFAVPSTPAAGGKTAIWSVDLDTRTPRQVVVDDKLTPDYTVTPDGRGMYFAARYATTIWWMPLASDGSATGAAQPTGLSTAGSSVGHLHFSASARRLSWTARDSTNHIWSVPLQPATGVASPGRALTEGIGAFFGFPAVSPRGRVAVVGSRPGESSSIFLVGARGAVRQITPDAGANHYGPSWMPGEREIAIVSDHDGETGFWAVDPETGRERPLFKLSDLPRARDDSQEASASPAANIAFNAAFDRLAMSVVTNGVANLWVAPMHDGRPSGPLVQRTFEHQGGSYPVWSPDGQWLAYQCYSGTDTHVCVVGAESGERRQLTNEPGQSWTGGWAPNSEMILFAARRAAVWNVASVSRLTGAARQLTQLAEPRFYVRYPRWDAANKRVVFERSETTGRIWAAALP
jgi:Tol biopolymer transport system component/DNA-binding winged helix-turn-helix (wHTH) protein